MPATAGDTVYPPHDFDSQLSMKLSDKGIFQIREAKYVTAFWLMAGSVACSASLRFLLPVRFPVLVMSLLLLFATPGVIRGFLPERLLIESHVQLLAGKSK
ncbi:hypothetical protein DK749_24820 [Salmonella enterica subsp. salamae]|nr:hypothetical protein [Salmonella enterica subsp. salamae]